MDKRGLNYISLFSSAGVGCFGFKKEDFHCIATNELIERRLDVQKANNKCLYESGYISGDITNKETKNKIFTEIDTWKKKEGLKEVDVLIATPPCQGMSVANHKKGDELLRNSLVIESIKLTNKIKPRFFIFENVRAFLNTLCIDTDKKEKKISEAIAYNLSGGYNILSKVINFKNYGVPSSRTRTLVIGIRKDLKDISPYDLFPQEEETKTIFESISNLPELKTMGEISPKDIFHNFKKYDKRMLDWIKPLKEGQSAFDNKNSKKRPHKIVAGEIIYNKNKNADKYRKCLWNQIAPCVHTRNDILASQSTIHPRDNRVFSIRELMTFMSIPKDFKWTKKSILELNKMSIKEKENYLSKNEINIRQSLGEAVPTLIFQKIAKNIKNIKKKRTTKEINELIVKNNLNNINNLLNFIKKNKKILSFAELSKISELSNSKRQETSAYYTSQDVVFSIIKELPELKEKESINILEPSGGCGNFIPLILKKYQDLKSVNIDICDIDNNALKVLKELIKLLNIPKNIKIKFIHDDFLLHNFNKKYDLVIGNPPFGKIIKKPELLKSYRTLFQNKKTNNIFSFFIEKSLMIGEVVSLITPKSLLSIPELEKTRDILGKRLSKIIDYGESAFDVKIETIAFITNLKNEKIKIISKITQDNFFLRKDYLLNPKIPYWIIYRNDFFDNISKKMTFDIFEAFRDRQITKKHTKEKGKYQVLKSRNLNSDGEIISIKNYDSYLDDLDNFIISRYLNSKSIIVPNLSYSPRAGILPENSIVDGSLAILIPKRNIKILKKHLKYFSSDEFKKFYRIVCNYGTRSLNINKNTVYFWGIKK